MNLKLKVRIAVMSLLGVMAHAPSFGGAMGCRCRVDLDPADLPYYDLNCAPTHGLAYSQSCECEAEQNLNNNWTLSIYCKNAELVSESRTITFPSKYTSLTVTSVEELN